MKKILIVLVIVVLAGLGWYVIKHRGAAAEPEAAAEKPAAKVETVAIVEGPIAQTVEAFGNVAASPSGDQVVSAPFDVIVRSVHVGVGSSVAAGDALMEVDPSADAKLAVDSAQIAQTQTDQALASVKERYDLRLATRQELQAAQQAADDARLKKASLAARNIGADGKITAKVAGIVNKLDVVPGAQVAAGTMLVTIATQGQMEVRLGVEASDVASISAGQAVTLQSANRSVADKVAATVRAVGGAIDPSTGAAEVRVGVPAGAPLFLGEHVKASIEVQRKEKVLTVPRSAVLPDGEKQILYTVKDGKAVRHEVTVGIETDELIEVSGADLKAGDLVVTLGNYELEDGMAVQGAEKAEPADEAKPGAKPAQEAKP